tara:strand:+ start:697 stop:984 length:288 start_codon:yes stop_codon:yes gene_type:complete
MKKFETYYYKETAKAILLDFDYGYNVYEKVWLPKSQLNILEKLNPTDEHPGWCKIEIPVWLIKKQTPTHTYSNVSPALAIANFITKNNSDVHCCQ